MPSKATILNSSETSAMVKDAKIVAFRWDIIPWCLVLDLDASAGEMKSPPVYRAWVVFVGMSELSWSVEAARLPNGIFITNPFTISDFSDGFHEFKFPLLVPTFSTAGDLRQNPHNRMILKAKGVLGARSITESHFGEFGPNREQRHSLATDEELLDAIGDAWKYVK